MNWGVSTHLENHGFLFRVCGWSPAELFWILMEMIGLLSHQVKRLLELIANEEGQTFFLIQLTRAARLVTCVWSVLSIGGELICACVRTIEGWSNEAVLEWVIFLRLDPSCLPHVEEKPSNVLDKSRWYLILPQHREHEFVHLRARSELLPFECIVS